MEESLLNKSDLRTEMHAKDNLRKFLVHLEGYIICVNISPNYGAFTPDVKTVLNENLVGILGGTQC
jgi:hypothetical protein